MADAEANFFKEWDGGRLSCLGLKNFKELQELYLICLPAFLSLMKICHPFSL